MAKMEPETKVNEISRISNGTELKGSLVSNNDIRIDGKVQGSIYTKGKVVIGESAHVYKGTIVCQSADVWGKLECTLYAGDVVSLKSTSTFSGVLNMPKLTIDIGAKFNGTCRMITQDEFKQVSAEFNQEHEKNNNDDKSPKDIKDLKDPKELEDLNKKPLEQHHK